MRRIYLLRHAEPCLSGTEKRCLSQTDLPLSPVGKLQGVLLRRRFAAIPLHAVYCSPLTRAVETAAFLTAAPCITEGLEELGVGCWEGLSFRQIREEYPELYRLRGEDPIETLIPGGEPPKACLARMRRTLEQLARHTEGDFAVVAHAGANRLLLCDLLQKPLREFLSIPQPYGCINVLREENGMFTVETVGMTADCAPDDALCREFWEALDVPNPVRRHCEAVADKAQQLAERLHRAAGEPILDESALRMAALLHDMARTEKQHPHAAAAWLERLGYSRLGQIIACHHDLPPEQEEHITEATILYLADKLVEEAREVNLHRRFSARLERLEGAARAACLARYEQAVRVQKRLEREENKPLE